MSDGMKRKGLSLLEVMVAVLIFSVLSVSLYGLLRGGISVRERLVVQGANVGMFHLNLENLARELRNMVSFRDDTSGFKGAEDAMQFYSLSFDYVLQRPRIRHITYQFNDTNLSKTVSEPFGSSTQQAFDFFENIENVTFSYFNLSAEEGGEWQPVWEDEKYIPCGIRITLTYTDTNGEPNTLTKYVFLHTAEIQ